MAEPHMDSLRDRIAAFINLPPAIPPPDICVIKRAIQDGYTRTLLEYPVPDGDLIEAFMFEPIDAESVGYVLALHQHNSQWLMGKSEVAGLVGDPLQAFGPVLARHGLTVLAPDAIGFESRVGAAGSGSSFAPKLAKPGATVDGWLQYYNQMAHRLVHGDLLMRKMLGDCMIAVSVLKNFNSDIPVGVIGHSLGGITSLFLGALDTRIDFTCSSGAVCSFRHKRAHDIGLEMSLVIPDFATQFDIDDIIRCIAPRSLFVVSSPDDPLSADASELVRLTMPAFQAHGSARCLQHLRVPGGHALDQARFDAIVEWAVGECRGKG